MFKLVLNDKSFVAHLLPSRLGGLVFYSQLHMYSLNSSHYYGYFLAYT